MFAETTVSLDTLRALQLERLRAQLSHAYDNQAPYRAKCQAVHVHPDDLGHVIGKQGRTARSLRLALGAAAGRIGRRASLEIAD